MDQGESGGEAEGDDLAFAVDDNVYTTAWDIEIDLKKKKWQAKEKELRAKWTAERKEARRRRLMVERGLPKQESSEMDWLEDMDDVCYGQCFLGRLSTLS